MRKTCFLERSLIEVHGNCNMKFPTGEHIEEDMGGLISYNKFSSDDVNVSFIMKLKKQPVMLVLQKAN